MWRRPLKAIYFLQNALSIQFFAPMVRYNIFNVFLIFNGRGTGRTLQWHLTKDEGNEIVIFADILARTVVMNPK